ncbi:MAG: Fic family protein [Candidatus Altiarchaeota archaeon]|nr:Fic family protein [Candidatus Altiarchaeota archaeon]
MVHVTKRTVRGKTYYYLEHTVREGSKVRKEERYLGKNVPKNIEDIKRSFLAEIYKTRWYLLLESIKENYSKELHRIPPSISAKQTRIFSIKFTYDTNRIEGSKLTYRETAELLEKGISPKGKPLDDVKEAEAHDRLFQEILGYRKDLNLRTVTYWHKKLLFETKPDIAGKIRDYQVAISGSKYMPPTPVEVYPLLKDYFSWYNKNKKNLNPVEIAAFAHLKLVTIHPFGDGNGRISRLVMNYILHREGYPMMNIPYENRTSYYNALERAQTKKQDHIFVQWFIKKYLKENKKYLKK